MKFEPEKLLSLKDNKKLAEPYLMLYTRNDVFKLLDRLQERFVGRLSDGDDSIYADIFKDARKDLETTL